jgi:hypothetical protein
MLIEKFDKSFVAARRAWFDTVIARYEDIYNIHPFSQQSGQSLTELYLLVKAFSPKTIIELGCGSRSSTFALSVAARELGDCNLFGIDINPVDFPSLMKRHFSHISYTAPQDIKVDASTFLLDDLLKPPVLLFYDAHDGDLPGVNISNHAIHNWFPKLKGQLIAFHDFSVAVDPQVDSSHVASQHFSGRYLKGYAEVISLTEWMNSQHIQFFRPAEELAQLGLIDTGSSLIYVRP